MENLQGKRSMVWAYMQNIRMFQALRDYGDRFDTVGLFTFEVDATGTLSETGTKISGMMPYIEKWPHIKWMLTINNGGIASIFTALRNNTGGAQDKFMTEMIRIMEKYPWCAGIDIDLERGGEYENKDKAKALFQRIYNTVKSYSSKKLVNVCLPGMTGVQGSVGGENWCVYGDLGPYCDTMAIMSYGEAWAGSAPGPTSSRDWLVKIYDYATQVVPPEKIFMGLPGYGWEWQLYDTPENLGKVYRAISLSYYGALGNMQGEFRYADTQAYIPFISYWDDYNKVPWGLLNVFDYLDGCDAQEYEYPLVADSYNRRGFITSYTSEQKVDFGTIYTTRAAADYDQAENIDAIGTAVTFHTADGYADYLIDLPSDDFVVALNVRFPFFHDGHKITIEFRDASASESDTEGSEEKNSKPYEIHNNLWFYPARSQHVPEFEGFYFPYPSYGNVPTGEFNPKQVDEGSPFYSFVNSTMFCISDTDVEKYKAAGFPNVLNIDKFAPISGLGTGTDIWYINGYETTLSNTSGADGVHVYRMVSVLGQSVTQLISAFAFGAYIMPLAPSQPIMENGNIVGYAGAPIQVIIGNNGMCSLQCASNFNCLIDSDPYKFVWKTVIEAESHSFETRIISPSSLECPGYTWPYYRQVCWMLVPDTDFLQGRSSVRMRIMGGDTVHNQQVYNIRICSKFSENRYAGEASFQLSPREYKDVDGNMVGPATGFKLTCEVLRREPDSALIWYEDFRGGELTDGYYTVQSGSWSVWQEEDSTKARPYAQLEGSGQLALNYDGFEDVHIRARVAFPSNGTGRAGIFYGNVFCCININTKCLELYQGSTLLGSYSADYERTADANIRDNPNMYSLEIRIRGASVRVYSGAGSVLRFTANITPIAKAYAGIRSDNPIKCELLRIGDAWWYEPYEAFDVIFPDGQEISFGRVSRTSVTWNEELNIFKVNSNIEESETRTEEISMSYDFFHSHIMEDISCGGDYTFKVTPRDINIWFSRLYLGDADGFGIQYYQDADSLIYWANQAAYHWKMRGFALWSLGQEDMRLWEMLPRQISK